MTIMKYKKFIPVVALAALFATSCDDQMMEWEERDPASEITVAEIPLKMEEKISRYDALNTYTDFKLGVGVGVGLYMEPGLMDSVVHQNFDEVVAGYIMKHGPMVQSDGSIDFTTADAFVEKAKNAGLSVFGHTLVWHQNQDASYLNGLIAPEVIPEPAGSNLLDISGLEDGSFTGWARNNQGDGITIEGGAGMGAGTDAMKLIASSSSANYWDLQIVSPEVPVIAGHEYQVTFFIKSDQPGAGRISMPGAANEYPWIDWMGTGSGTEAFETTSTWQQVQYSVSEFAEGSTGFSLSFDLGSVPDVTYYIDVNTIKVVDLDAEPTVVNMISNGDFENGTLDPWNGWGNESTRAVSAEGEGYGDTGYSMVLTNPTAADSYSAQQVYTFDQPLEEGVDYSVSFMIKSSVATTIQVQLQNPDYGGDYYGGLSVGTTWTPVEFTATPSTADKNKFVFDFGATAATFHIDNVVLGKAPQAPSGAPELKVAKAPTYIEKTDEEKAQLIGAAMEDFITQMVSHYKNDITAWDVVNEPMNNDGTLRDGNVSDPASDEFYWQKYLGKDFAVTAFNLAREHGNQGDILFINDYGLESSIAKCEGLIDYVEYIENQGATVDGIGTQMHISINTNKDNIVQMFELLAATGKMIKVSELDVQVLTDAPSAEQFEQQAEMYQFVADKYREIIPEAQQYGITVWGISDAPAEHENWLPDDAPCLWDADYERKVAYKYFADGLAGRDVSEDFTGELEE
jgi:GH35 family endo-1,4-beta-xylanase